MVKVKAHELREKKKDDLLKQLDDMKNELAQLQVAKVSGQGGPSKLSKIDVLRKSIARILTVYNQNERVALKTMYRGYKFKPLDLRPKRTRALRRELTIKQKTKLTERQQKRQANFPPRKFAVKAT
jgi:large subunit ribosomal protein L35e